MVKLVKTLTVKAETKPDHLVGACTERRWMTHKHKDRMFDILTVMQENNNPAFDILMDIFTASGDSGFHEVAIALDDMNIRGEQIVIALAHCRTQFKTPALQQLCDIALSPGHDERQRLVDAVNTTWIKAFMETAVLSGAHKWLHKKIVTPPNV